MKATWLKLYWRKFTGLSQPNFIVVVSGLPRSGTSLMMKMLAAGGLSILTDHRRVADESNPKGYFEYDRVKRLKDGDVSWLPEASGKAVKIISALLEYLPPAYAYKVIFMRRDVDEILASQRQMLVRNGEDPNRVSDAELKHLFQDHLRKVETWLSQQPAMDTLMVSYNNLLAGPNNEVKRIQEFLGMELDLRSMYETVDPRLYRQRLSARTSRNAEPREGDLYR